MPPSIKPIERIQGNLLARAERRLLNWLCARLPAWVTPDMLTSLALVGAALVLAGYVGSHGDPHWLWLAIAGYLLHWFGDSLDGSVARYRQIERPRFGYFVDHSADGFGTLMIVGGLGLSPFVRLDVALFALAGYYLLSIHAFLTVKVLGELRLSYAAAGPTELRLLLIGMTLLMLYQGRTAPVIANFSGLDLVISAIAAVLIILFVIQTAAIARRIAQEGE